MIGVESSTSARGVLDFGSLRRQLRAELVHLCSSFSGVTIDSESIWVVQWYDRFTDALKRIEDASAVLAQFGEELVVELTRRSGGGSHPIVAAAKNFLINRGFKLPFFPEVTPPPVRCVFEHTLRTQIRAELATFNTILAYPLADRMTASLNAWHRDFVGAVYSGGELEAIVADFTLQLQGLMCDAVDRSPFEEVSYLGSDGLVYGEKALCCYLHRGQFPPLFTVARHPIVEAAVLWLKKHEAAKAPLPALVEEYQRLLEAGETPEVPTDPIKVRNRERARELRLKQAERKARLDKAKKEMSDRVAEAAAEYVDQLLGGLAVDAEERRRRDKARIAEMRAKAAAESKKFEEEAAEIASSNRKIKERTDELEGRLDLLYEGIASLDRKAHQLEEAIAATRRAIEEKNQRDAEGAFGQIGLIVAMAAASYFTGVSIAQPPGGGAIVGVVFPI